MSRLLIFPVLQGLFPKEWTFLQSFRKWSTESHCPASPVLCYWICSQRYRRPQRPRRKGSLFKNICSGYIHLWYPETLWPCISSSWQCLSTPLCRAHPCLTVHRAISHRLWTATEMAVAQSIIYPFHAVPGSCRLDRGKRVDARRLMPYSHKGDIPEKWGGWQKNVRGASSKKKGGVDKETDTSLCVNASFSEDSS